VVALAGIFCIRKYFVKLSRQAKLRNDRRVRRRNEKRIRTDRDVIYSGVLLAREGPGA
jgi:hypothetical protein